MTITVKPEIEALIRQKVETGPYDSVSAVVEEAMGALDERERVVRLREAIAIADAQLDRGESNPYSAELLSDIAGRARDAIARGTAPKPDVVP